MHWTSAACLALALWVPPAGALELRPLQSVIWSEDDAEFGGFSGLAVADAGRWLWAASDGGTLWRAEIERGADGRVLAFRTLWHDRFLDNKGGRVSGFTEDAEALAAGPDGRLFLGYESYSRITGLRPPDMRPEPLHAWNRFKTEWSNQGFEGLARLPDGNLLAVVEARDEAAGGYRTFLGRKGAWRTGPVLGAGPGFGASDATVDGEGRLWLLERRLTWLGQFEVRVSTCPVAAAGKVDCAEVMTAPPGTLGNMEGMSVWRDRQGRRILTLISDDNFSALSSTAIVEYEILP